MLLSAATTGLLGGCVVISVVDTAGTVAVKTVGLAADAAIGTVKFAGKAIGKAADATLGSDKDPKK
jgi:hypothetical protein